MPGHPEGVPQPRVAALRQVRGPAKLPRLLGAEIEAAVLEKLPRTAEAAEVARFGQDDHRQNRPDAREGLQPDKVGLRRQPRRDVRLQTLAQLAERAILLEHDPKHAHRLRRLGHGQPETGARGLVEVGEPPRLVDFPSGDLLARRRDEGRFRVPAHGRRDRA